jgi:hypothetical protein
MGPSVIIFSFICSVVLLLLRFYDVFLHLFGYLEYALYMKSLLKNLFSTNIWFIFIITIKSRFTTGQCLS